MLNVPSQKKTSNLVLSGFKGVDFTSRELNSKRSPNAYNFVINDGEIESRDGYKTLATFNDAINGVWNVDTDNGDRFIVHSGTKLYQTNKNFGEITELIVGMNDCLSRGLYMQGQLFIFDGKRTAVYGKFGDTYMAKFADTIGYIPITRIQMLPTGGGEAYEEINMLSMYRINMFCGTKDDTVYCLNEQSLNLNEVYIRKLTEDGWISLIENKDFTVNREEGKITFNIAPGETPVAQEDNIEVKYAKDFQSDVVNKSDIITSYGYDGNNNRIFIAKDNYVYYSYQDNPYYFPDRNYIKIGQEPIMNFIRTNDGKLGVQKKLSDTDATIYYLTSAIFDGKEVFVLQEGVKTIGCISRYANANLINDSLTLTEQGVYAIANIDGEKYALQRDYYVNARLMTAPNLDKAYAVAVDGRYYLAINGNIYIADNRYKSYNKQSKTEDYQYEWYFWKDIPARILFRWNNELYFGTEDGKICNFSNGNLDETIPVNSYYETNIMDFGTSNYTKTVKIVTLVSNPIVDSSTTLKYENEDGESEVLEFDNLSNKFPKVIQQKEKIRKFMYLKFIFSNSKDKKMNIKELNIDYMFSGRYKG